MSYEASSSSLSNQILAVEARICELNKQRTKGTSRRGGHIRKCRAQASESARPTDDLETASQ